MRDELLEPSVKRNMQSDPDCQKQLIVSQHQVIFDELKNFHLRSSQGLYCHVYSKRSEQFLLYLKLKSGP